MKQNLMITQALKEKNKIAAKIQRNWARIVSTNSLPKGAYRPYDLAELKDETFKLTDELIELKTKTHEASAPVRSMIFRLSELKSILGKLETINTKEGLVKERFDNSLVEMEAIISTKDIDDMMTMYQDEIDDIQTYLDTFNYTTKIE